MFRFPATCLTIIIWVFFCSSGCRLPCTLRLSIWGSLCVLSLSCRNGSLFPKYCCYGLNCNFLSTICRLVFCGNLYGFQVRIQFNRSVYLVFRRQESNRWIPILGHSPFPPLLPILPSHTDILIALKWIQIPRLYNSISVKNSTYQDAHNTNSVVRNKTLD